MDKLTGYDKIILQGIKKLISKYGIKKVCKKCNINIKR